MFVLGVALAQYNFDFSQARPDGSAQNWSADQAVVEDGALRVRVDGAPWTTFQNHTPPRRRFRAQVRLRGEGPLERAVLSIETGDAASTVLGVAGPRRVPGRRWRTWVSPWITLPDAPEQVSVTLRVEGSGTVWFDDIALFDEQGTFPVLQPPPAVPHVFPDRHWTETERRVAPLSAVVAPEHAAWVRDNHHPITSLGAVDTSDLSFLAGELEGARVVQLGESTHGGEDFNALRLRLVRYLHEELGYDVLAFESSMVSCDAANELLRAGDPGGAMRACLFTVWWTAEMERLFAYAASTAGTERPLRIAGFDAQLSGRDGDGTLDRRIQRVFGEAAPGLLGLLARQEALEDEDAREAWIRELDALLGAVDPSALGGEAMEQQTLLAWLRAQPRMVRHRASDAEGLRGVAMGELILDLTRLHPDSGVITWAHNFHVRHDGEAVVGAPSHGQVLRRRLGDQVFTLGAYMGSGSHARNDGEAVWVKPPPDGSLEAILASAGEAVHYVRLRGQEGASWANVPLHTWDFGYVPEILVPRDQYDALLYVHEMSPPAFVD